MIALIDLGNTRAKVALYQDQWLKAWEVCSPEDWQKIEAEVKAAQTVVVGSVVPAKTCWFDSLKTGRKYHELTHLSPWSFQIAVENPHSIGVDRLANMEAVVGYEGCVIVVDAGTATKFDLLEGVGKKVFAGGAIAPGMRISYEALLAHGAQLKPVDLEKHSPVVGYNTETAIRSGVLHGFAAQVDGMVARFFEEKNLPAGTTVVATGGYSKFLSGRAKFVREYRQRLTLEGMLAIAKKL